MSDRTEDFASVRTEHGNCHTEPCRSLRCPAEIDRLPLEELRRFARRQWHLIEAFRRQHNYHLNCIRDLEQQIKTLKSNEEIEQVRKRLALALYEAGAYCGNCEYDGWGSCDDCREVVYRYVDALGLEHGGGVRG